MAMSESNEDKCSGGRYWDFSIDSIFDNFSPIFSISILLKLIISLYQSDKHLKQTTPKTEFAITFI